jgi:hypothetical protein
MDMNGFFCGTMLISYPKMGRPLALIGWKLLDLKVEKLSQ